MNKLETIKEVAKEFDVRNVKMNLLKKVANKKNLEEALKDKEVGEFLLLVGFALGCAKRNRLSLDMEELMDEVHDLYVNLILEYLVRTGSAERIGKWNSLNCSYKITKKGESEVKRLLRRRFKKKVDLSYIS